MPANSQMICHTINLVIWGAINGIKLPNIFDILEVDMSKQTASFLHKHECFMEDKQTTKLTGS